MAALRIHPYARDRQAHWDGLVKQARNGCFLFERGYMDYHADRFQDASLMLFEDDLPVAALPAHRQGKAVISHGGLTFGGLLVRRDAGVSQVISWFDALVNRWRAEGVERLVYKPMPHVFHRQPSEDDLYALHRLGARTMRCDLSTTIDLARRPPLAKGRRHNLSKARRAGVEVRRSDDYDAFWTLLSAVLAERHDAEPTHQAAEMALLARRFSRIELHAAYTSAAPNIPLAGVVTYRYDDVLHTQYMANSSAGRELGALDAVIAHLIEHETQGLRWLSFGVSSVDGGRQLNAGLAAQKEMFGGRSTVAQWLELDLQETAP